MEFIEIIWKKKKRVKNPDWALKPKTFIKKNKKIKK